MHQTCWFSTQYQEPNESKPVKRETWGPFCSKFENFRRSQWLFSWTTLCFSEALQVSKLISNRSIFDNLLQVSLACVFIKPCGVYIVPVHRKTLISGRFFQFWHVFSLVIVFRDSAAFCTITNLNLLICCASFVLAENIHMTFMLVVSDAKHQINICTQIKNIFCHI